MRCPQLGFPDDGYDYLQHCRTIGASAGAGATYVPTTVKPVLPVDARVYDARQASPAAAPAVPILPGAPHPLLRNAELEAVMEAIASAQAAAEGEEAAGERLEEEAGEGDMEDDFLLSLGLEAGGLADAIAEGDESEEEEEGTDRVRALRRGAARAHAAQEDELDGWGEEAEEEEEGEGRGEARAPRPLDEAFEALALEYSDDEIGCACRWCARAR